LDSDGEEEASIEDMETREQ
jgi:hypothetical protein